MTSYTVHCTVKISTSRARISSSLTRKTFTQPRVELVDRARCDKPMDRTRNATVAKVEIVLTWEEIQTKYAKEPERKRD
jgi:hypothetical protein